MAVGTAVNSDSFKVSTPSDCEIRLNGESVVTSVLTEEGDKTRLTATVAYPSVEVRDAVIASGMAKGAGISYDRREDVLAKLQSGR